MDENTPLTRRGMLAAVGTAGAAALGGESIASAQPQPAGQQPAKPKKGPVRVAISVAVANDLPKLTEGITQLVERLACRVCFSGWDCMFRVEVDRKPHFQITDGRKVTVTAPDPDGDPARAVSVKLPADVSSNIDRVKEAVRKVVGELGCRGCCSGFDIAFQHEIRTLTVDKALNVKEAIH
jgi:hypothetical protein